MSIYSYICMTTKEKEIKAIGGLEKIAEASTIFKLLADPTRLKILCLLFDNKEGLCVNEIAEHVGISHSAASHQLAKLEARSVVSSFRDGQMVCYAVVENKSNKNLERVVNLFRG